MPSEEASLEQFRELTLRGPLAERDALRHSLIANAKDGWTHSARREEQTREGGPEREVIVFEHGACGGLEAASLFLFWWDVGYAVTNIVPIKLNQLGRAAYNALLEDFVAKVANPVAATCGFKIDMTAPQQTLDDWVEQPVARALRSFSRAANKGTGSSHPMDGERWRTFVILAHQTNAGLSTDRLIRWLHEVEGWSEDVASDLAIEYEQGLSLLRQYDGIAEQ